MNYRWIGQLLIRLCLVALMEYRDLPEKNNCKGGLVLFFVKIGFGGGKKIGYLFWGRKKSAFGGPEKKKKKKKSFGHLFWRRKKSGFGGMKMLGANGV